MSTGDFLGLARACSRLSLNAGDLAEAALHAVDCGWSEREAMTMTLRESLQRQGKYHGILKTLVDSGAVFQLREDGGHDRRGVRRMGGDCLGSDSASSSPRGFRDAGDARRRFS